MPKTDRSSPQSASRTSSAGAGFSKKTFLLLILSLLVIFLVCLLSGSVQIPLSEALSVFRLALSGRRTQALDLPYGQILLNIRLPRVLCAALTGASLSLCGAAMQGLLQNPLADGSTLGVSSGASLGAALSIALGITFPSLPFAGTMVMAILFAFGSLLIILTLSYRLDRSLSTSTIILLGVVYSMFVSALLSLVITFAGEKVHSIVFWTMGSLSGSTYLNALVLLGALLICGGVLLSLSKELNALSVSEDHARGIGVPLRRTKLAILIAVSCLIGVCVSIGGCIGFVGLITPHLMRLLFGPNHEKLLPACLFSGAGFLMLTDLAARTLLRPRELPIGVVTSLIGAVVFVVIFRRSRKGRAA